MDKLLYTYWTNVSKPGSFVGLDKLYKAVKADGHKITRKQVDTWLNNRYTYQLHKPVNKRFTRKSIIVSGPHILWDVDLLDLKEYQRFNNKYRYILTVLDVFSRKAYGEALTNKSASSTAAAFQRILNIEQPEAVRTDHGNEFKREFNKLLKDHTVKHILTSSPEIKANYVERFHRTFRDKLTKFMTYNNTQVWIKIYKMLINSYNKSPHRSIKNIAPNNVTRENTGEILEYLLKNTLKLKKEKPFQLGDIVRICKYKRIFTKASKETFTDELFVITTVSTGKPKLYTLRDLTGELIIGSFYGQELQMAETDAIDHKRIAKAINTGKNNYNVKFKNWPKAFDTTLNKKQLVSYTKPK